MEPHGIFWFASIWPHSGLRIDHGSFAACLDVLAGGKPKIFVFSGSHPLSTPRVLCQNALGAIRCPFPCLVACLDGVCVGFDYLFYVDQLLKSDQTSMLFGNSVSKVGPIIARFGNALHFTGHAPLDQVSQKLPPR